jgi:hypothetical protein
MCSNDSAPLSLLPGGVVKLTKVEARWRQQARDLRVEHKIIPPQTQNLIDFGGNGMKKTCIYIFVEDDGSSSNITA